MTDLFQLDGQIAVVTGALLRKVEDEWQDRVRGRQATIERSARLAASRNTFSPAGRAACCSANAAAT